VEPPEQKEPLMSDPTAASLVGAARARVECLSPAQVAAELESDVLLVDLREPEELLAHGRIAGSVRAPRGRLEFWADPAHHLHRSGFHPNRRVILYSGSGARSALAADTLQDMGYRRVAHLAGGLEAWKRSGFPVEQA
jgi:rhodanese-related sulfurtransferase